MFKLINGDCLEVMQSLIDDGVKVDMVLTDPPYGTTACKWDSIIPFEPMWELLTDLTYDNTPIVLFGSEPFSSTLRISNIKNYRYDWKWDKVRGVGHLLAHKRPMMCVEDIMIFYRKLPNYYPQMREREKPRLSQNNGNNKVWGGTDKPYNGKVLDKKFPINLLTFSKSNMQENNYHSTQKPTALLEYLIKTYTKEDDLVLDFTMGSGSTGVACLNTNRQFIGIELDPDYYQIAKERCKSHQTKLEVH